MRKTIIHVSDKNLKNVEASYYSDFTDQRLPLNEYFDTPYQPIELRITNKSNLKDGKIFGFGYKNGSKVDIQMTNSMGYFEYDNTEDLLSIEWNVVFNDDLAPKPENFDNVFFKVPEEIADKVIISYSEEFVTKYLSVNEWVKAPYSYDVDISGGVLLQGDAINGAGVLLDGSPTNVSMTGGGNSFQYSGDSVGAIEWNIIPETSDDYDQINNLYLMDKESIYNLSKRGWYVPIIGSDVVIDSSSFFINLMQYPFKIDDSIIGADRHIVAGTHAFTDIEKVPTVNGDLLRLGLGSIEIPAKYENSLDLLSEIEVVLPFISDTVTLNSDKAMGKKLDFEYIVSLFDGVSTFNIYDGGELLISQSVNVGRSIPFESYSEIQGSLEGRNGVVNTLQNVRVDIKRPNVSPSEFGNLVNKEGLLLNESGFVTVDEIKLVTEALASEVSEIKSVLNSGVFIND